ncbi:MAG: ATP-dependent Clp protease adaptor ClpS [Flavobacteriales bacterium]|jgi:ATP-dependent Clp protease adaptor protein ClpS|tara:strand:- start:43264 stop:43545 length:282 start_codon:yes stop_codon:yes gene_type:complete
MKIINSTHTQEDSDVLLEEAISNKIVLFNDEVNSFDFVIDALIKVCLHEAIQAEQCTILVHFKGRCTVKEGDYNDLEPMCTALLDRGLTAEIQ